MANSYAWNTDAPLVIAHRGASSIVPENTLPAFIRALEMGADAVEMDLKISRDGVLFVHHDRALERTTDGSGHVSNKDWSELRQLDAGSYFGEEFSGVRIPRLEQVFKTLGDQLLYNLELTEYGRPFTNLVQKTIEMVDRFNLQARVLYSSFSPIELFKVSRIVGASKAALLIHSRTPSIVRLVTRILVPHETYHPQDAIVDQELVTFVKNAEKKVNVWTVNQPGRLEQLLKWGVDGLITDFPARAVETRNRLEVAGR